MVSRERFWVHFCGEEGMRENGEEKQRRFLKAFDEGGVIYEHMDFG